jgi:predicted kinase
MTLVVMGGLPGSGKSTVSRALAEKLGAVLVQSDVVRMKLFPRERTYTAPEHAKTFAEVHRRIEAALQQGYHVVYDATNLKQRDRAGATKIADKYGVSYYCFRMFSSLHILRAMVAVRELDENCSEASVAVFDRMASNLRPEDSLGTHPLAFANSVENNVDFILATINGEANPPYKWEFKQDHKDRILAALKEVERRGI